MSTFTCFDLGDIHVIAHRKKSGQAYTRLVRTQYNLTTDAFQTFRNIAGTISSVASVERYRGSDDADLIITMADGITAQQARDSLDNLLQRVCKYLERARMQQERFATGGAGFAVSGELTMREVMHNG